MFKYLFLFISTIALSQNTIFEVRTSEEYDNAQKRIRERDEETINQIPEQIRSKYDKIRKFEPYFEPLFLVTQNEKKGIIDLNGRIIVPADYENIELRIYNTDRQDDYQILLIAYNSRLFPQRYYSKKGSLIAESYSYYARYTDNGQIIKIQTIDGKIKIFNIFANKFINTKKYDIADSFFLDGLLKVERNGNKYLLNLSGKETKIN